MRNIAGAGVWLSLMKVEALGKQLHKDNVRKFIDTLFPGPSKLGQVWNDDYKKAESARLWLTPMAWAVFFAYAALVSYVVFVVDLLKMGMDPTPYVNRDGIAQLVDEVFKDDGASKRLVETSQYVEVQKRLENRLLEELRLVSSGAEADHESAERARRVLGLANKIVEAGQEATNPKPG